MTFNMQMQDIFQTKPRLSHNDDETFRIKKESIQSWISDQCQISDEIWEFVESCSICCKCSSVCHNIYSIFYMRKPQTKLISSNTTLWFFLQLFSLMSFPLLLHMKTQPARHSLTASHLLLPQRWSHCFSFLLLTLSPLCCVCVCVCVHVI